jgi:hypothetical protein
MPSDYLPKDTQSMCEWLENWKIEFAADATTMGFTGPEITSVLTDANWALYACRSSADAASFASAWINFRDGLLNGDPNAPVGATPATVTPAAPAVPAPGRGIVTRIRATVKRIKGAAAYTQSIGQALRILPTGVPVDPETAKPAAKARPLPMFQAQVRWNKTNLPRRAGAIAAGERKHLE